MRSGLAIVLLWVVLGLSSCDIFCRCDAEGVGAMQTPPATLTLADPPVAVRDGTAEVAHHGSNGGAPGTSAATGFGGDQPASAGDPAPGFGGDQSSSAGVEAPAPD